MDTAKQCAQCDELAKQLRGQKQLMDRALASQSKILFAEKARVRWEPLTVAAAQRT